MLDILKFLDPNQIRRSVLAPREGVVSARLRNAGVTEELILDSGLIENIYEPASRPMERSDFAAHPALKALRAATNVVRATLFVLRLVWRVRFRGYDAVFCNGTTANFAGGAVAVFARVPVVWHVFYSSVGPAIRPLHRRLAAARHVRAILCVSEVTARQFGHSTKPQVIHDALDIGEFSAIGTQPRLRSEFALEAGTVVFGAHGRILRRKGFVELIEAARIVIGRLESHERARCRFFVFGDTPEDLRPDHLQECRALVNGFGLAEYVQFPGFRADIQDYVADFDVALVPSIYEDPLPRAVMEPMALAKPVIAFAMGGIPEMITDGIEGRLVCGFPPDVEGFAAACLEYFRDPGLRRRAGAAARARVERDFDARQHARLLQEEIIRCARSR